MKKFLYILIFMLPLNCFAQSMEDIGKFENLFDENSHTHNWVGQMKNNKNELSFLFSSFFVMYKELLSSQDVDACVFTPSCSVYAIESIKKYGAVKGYFNAIDRLARCNPGRNKNLPIDSKTGKYYDPPE